MLLNAFLRVAEGSLELWLLCALVMFITWTALNALSLCQMRPKKIIVVGDYLPWVKWATTLKFITHGSDTISNSYQKVKHAPFAVPAVKEYMILVSRPEQILEVARCPEAILSFHAAMKDRLRHKITMMGFEHNHIDPDEYVTLQVVKVHLRKNMGVFNPVIHKAVLEGFRNEFLKAES
ncbi:hypothetical protein diail_9660 [Diaporthe ilicicola]|nr:hypothetical protein diail_9660 [Diaporthe ilicicola]